MSPVSPEELDGRRYGGVNGNGIILTEKRTGENNKVIEFILHNDSLIGIKRNLLFFCITLLLSNLTNSFTFVTVSVVALAFQCKRIATSVDFDSLLVVESVGVQISSTKIFSGFNSSQFLPWTSVDDVFINEVIIGQRVLYFLTFVVKEFIDGKERTRLVPLFSELKPSKECLEYMDNKEFSYKDELLKVIRRIIKCQSSQGQLNTLHLFVTYKHTFWTRQDKMFAILKLPNKKRSAAFSQAFVLTISFKSSEGSNEEFAGTSQEAEDTMNLTRLHSFSKFGNELVNVESIMTTTTATIDSSINLKDVTDIGFDGSESLEAVITKQQSRSRVRKKDTRLNLSSEMKRCDDLTDVVISECDQSPRVIDDCRSTNWCKYLQDSISTNGGKTKGEEKIDEVVVGSELNIPRSSDITDQVMEGLMFTIKQDEDNIKVVEQRTKMELDEVLENSEKIETKEGEKCLVNSSLLGLENLLTKIEVPNKQLKTNTTTNSTVKNDEKISPFSMLVRNHNGFFTAGFSSFQHRKEVAIPISCTNRIPSPSSLESNGNDHVSNKLSPTNGSDANKSPKVRPLRMSGDMDVIRSFDQNVIERKRRRIVVGTINSPMNRQSRKTEEQKILNNSDKIGNCSTDENNSYPDNNIGDDNNNNSDNNNINTTNNCNGTSDIVVDEVQIDMWKLLQDIARGVKVMVERISDTDIKNATKSQTIPGIRTSVAHRLPTKSTK